MEAIFSEERSIPGLEAEDAFDRAVAWMGSRNAVITEAERPARLRGIVPFGTSRAAVYVQFERTDGGTVARAEVSPLTGLSPLPHPRALALDLAGTLYASLTEGRADMGELRSKRKEAERSYRAGGRERVVQGLVIALVGVMISAIIFLSEGAEGIGPVPLALTILLVCVGLAVAAIGAQIVTMSRQMVRIDRELFGEER